MCTKVCTPKIVGGYLTFKLVWDYSPHLIAIWIQFVPFKMNLFWKCTSWLSFQEYINWFNFIFESAIDKAQDESFVRSNSLLWTNTYILSANCVWGRKQMHQTDIKMKIRFLAKNLVIRLHFTSLFIILFYFVSKAPKL